MQTFRIASDFHLEFYDYKSHIGNPTRDINHNVVLPVLETDKDSILLLAGDTINIHKFSQYQKFFEDISQRFREIVIISGNHDYYGNDMFTSKKDYETCLSSYNNITLLENETIVFDDVAIFGGTLWTDFAESPISMLTAQAMMNDYRLIKYGGKTLNANITVQEYYDCVEKMLDFIQENDYNKKIVMTHHAPSYKSCAPQFKGSSLNPAFLNNLDDIIADSDIDLYVHGHVHNNCDYMLGKTRVACNPYGYYNENPDYRNLVINI